MKTAYSKSELEGKKLQVYSTYELMVNNFIDTALILNFDVSSELLESFKKLAMEAHLRGLHAKIKNSTTNLDDFVVLRQRAYQSEIICRGSIDKCLEALGE